MLISSSRAFLIAASLSMPLSSCSSSSASATSSSSKSYPVSPYDRDSNPEKESNPQSDADVDLPEDELLERAKSAYDSELYSVARDNWTKLREQYPSSYYATLAELKIGDTYYFSGDYSAAITAYEEFTKLHPAHEATPYVRYQIGNAYREQYAGVEHDQSPLNTALKNYQKLLDEYPRSEYSLEARRTIDSSRELLAKHELFIADFYARQGLEQASLGRLKSIVENYADTATAHEVLLKFESSDKSDKSVKATALRSKEEPGEHAALPRKPELLTSRAESPPNAEARFRMQEQTGDESQNGGRQIWTRNRDEAPPAAQILSPLLWVNCEAINGLFVYTAALDETLESRAMTTQDVSRFDVLLARRGNTLNGSVEKDLRLEKHCAVENKELRFYSVKNQDPQNVVVAELENVAPQKISVFVLDRPVRLVLIVDNN